MSRKSTRHRIITAVALLGALLVAARASGGSTDYVLQPEDRASRPVGVVVPKFQYSFGAPAQWPGALHWRYNPANAPMPYVLDKAAFVDGVIAASAKWTAVCGIDIVYDGETSAPPNALPGGHPDRSNVVGWQTLGASSAGITYSWYSSTPGGARTIIDADIIADPANVASAAAVARTFAHEWGHALGLAHSNVANAVMSGIPDTPYSFLTELTADDTRGCRCLYGPSAGQSAGFVCSLPTSVDFGTVSVGSTSNPVPLSVTNAGNASLTVGNITTNGVEFSVESSSCGGGRQLAPGATCTFSIGVRPTVAGTRSDELALATSDGAYRVPLRADAAGSPPPASTVAVIEFYHQGLDHYFISSLAADIDALDSGRFTGWTRTGRGFRAYPTSQGGGSAVCRIYIPSPGESHFFSASAGECADTLRKFPQLVLESSDVMYVGLPNTVSGACSAGWTPIYRVWNQRGDSNHRYVTDRALRDAMVAKGYIAEGYGPDVVIMCAPP